MVKKRAMITVDKDAWEGIQSAVSELSFPPAAFNAILNQFLKSRNELLQELKKRRAEGNPVTLSTFKEFMSPIVDDFNNQMELDLEHDKKKDK